MLLIGIEALRGPPAYFGLVRMVTSARGVGLGAGPVTIGIHLTQHTIFS